jgi:beta-glucosidase
VTDGGYLHGALAPGHKNKFEAPIASHNIMRAHGAAVKVYREVGAHEIGLVVNIEPKYPASDRAEDIAAATRADAYMNRQYLDPALKGEYPSELKDIFGEAWPDWPGEDLVAINQPVDFIGINYYTRNVVRHDETQWPLKAGMVMQVGKTYTETGWEVHAPALVDLLKGFKARYGDIPLYITENGAAFYDPPVAPPEGVHAPLRVAYLKSHIAAVGEAIAAGVDIRGYMLWSLFDNLEWSLGYSKRFGMVHVDFVSQTRTPKASAALYSRVIAINGEATE